MFGIIILAFALIILKGSSEGQSSFFGVSVQDYIEETSITFANIVQSSSQLSEIDSLSPFQIAGSGGEENGIDPPLLQQSSVLAYNPAIKDYLDNIGSKRNNIVEYTVQDGDLISFIASDFGVSMNSIISANNLRYPDNLQIGQVLKIPPVSGIIHKVKSGDTISSLAKKYGVSEEIVIDFNSLPRNGHLTLNTEIVIPGGRITSTSTPIIPLPPQGSKRFAYLPDLGSFFMAPTSGFNWGRIHGRNGVDVANSCGTPIYASADGMVANADSVGWNGGFGQFIKLIHDNGTETLYAHASKLLVTEGQSVPRGTLIALMGTTGRSTGCHLHFEVHGAKNLLATY